MSSSNQLRYESNACESLRSARTILVPAIPLVDQLIPEVLIRLQRVQDENVILGHMQVAVREILCSRVRREVISGNG